MFTERDFNPMPGAATSFAFSSTDDEVYLFSGDGTNITGYLHGFKFGAAANGITFGRYLDSQGREQFVAQSANTLGTNNAYPLVGPVVIDRCARRGIAAHASFTIDQDQLAQTGQGEGILGLLVRQRGDGFEGERRLFFSDADRLGNRGGNLRFG